ncbi:MAG: GNAT family N-acetyltransferase [Clostridia bacterium]|nr:GNAT family N-acetyltransferase [Clostridia bacterium]
MRSDDINYLGIDRVLKRGTGQIIERSDDALLVYDTVSGAFFLDCDDCDTGIAVLNKHEDKGYRLLMTVNEAVAKEAFTRYGFDEMLECYQVAYFNKAPETDDGLTYRIADENDLDALIAVYDRISPKELSEVVKRRNILLAYDGKSFVGFMGEHLEGSMGLLYVFPKYRRKGYGAAVEKKFIAMTIEKGFVPFGQVEKDNEISLRLQEKLGLDKSDKLIFWMWKL